MLFTRSEHTGKTKVKSLLMNKNETKAAFAERLNRLCDESPLIREKNRGRNVDLAKHTGTRSETCRRWVEGLNYPEMKHIEKLCDLFDANIGWLLSGVGAPYRNDIADAGPTFRHGIRARFLPVLHPGEALTFEGDYSDIEPIYWYPTDLQVGAYWLEITDDSMNAGTGDTFRPGTIVLVNPEAEPGNNDLGIIHLPKWGEVLCRQFIKQGPERSAVAYNPNYPKVDANDPGVEIIGKVEDAVIRLMRGR